jgi:pimeloyl-ACP methyl ester carboxylesterase
MIPGHDGVPIAVWEYGGDGPPLLLTHCTGGLARTWDPIAESLRKEAHVYSVDTRGHGDSGKPDHRAAYRWILSGHDLLAVLDALGLPGKARAVGHSGGGAHVAYAAWLHPDAFSKLLLMDAIISPEAIMGPACRALAAGARRRKTHFHNRDVAQARIFSKGPLQAWSEAAQTLFLEHGLEKTARGEYTLKCPSEIEAWCYEEGGAADLFSALHEVELPVQLLSGEDSEVLPVVQTQHAALPNSRLHVLEDIGHFLPQQSPEAVQAFMRSWLNDTLEN